MTPIGLVTFFYTIFPPLRTSTLLCSIYTLKSLIEEQTGINEQGWKKSAALLAYLLSKSINEQGGIFRLLHEK